MAKDKARAKAVAPGTKLPVRQARASRTAQGVVRLSRAEEEREAKSLTRKEPDQARQPVPGDPEAAERRKELYLWIGVGVSMAIIVIAWGYNTLKVFGAARVTDPSRPSAEEGLRRMNDQLSQRLQELQEQAASGTMLTENMASSEQATGTPRTENTAVSERATSTIESAPAPIPTSGRLPEADTATGAPVR